MEPGGGLLLGKHTPVVEVYSPELLYPIARSIARDTLGIAGPTPFHGADLWHLYELSWLDATGKPVARVGRVTVPCSSPSIVESKSFKLYLNSLNNTRFEDDATARACIETDIGNAAQAPVSLVLYKVDDPGLAGQGVGGTCLDEYTPAQIIGEADPATLKLAEGGVREEQLHSHLLRSLCPVTGQPDWATLWLHYRGKPLDHSALLAYVISYRQHQEYHEQCVERMFRDISARCQPEFLHIQAFYTRRGGLDINPFRSSEPGAGPLPRLNRQ